MATSLPGLVWTSAQAATEASKAVQRRWPVLLMVAVLGMTACGQDSSSSGNQIAAPPAFAPSGSATNSAMDELGYQLALLERELTEDEYNAIDQDEVVAILEAMELAASSFQAVEAGESHWFLQERLPAFVDALTQARIAAASRPPRYYLAGKVAGGCVSCHAVNP